ncbi:unnamed protein product, partial [Laminaria digitata]
LELSTSRYWHLGTGNMTQDAPVDRYSHLRATMGTELFDKVQKAKLLVVGAGGIGCELLKNLVQTGFQDIEVVDLDTIDKSNLNRQFLFRPHHVDNSKALMAKEAVLKFNPKARIVAHHGNVKESQFGLPFVRKFDIVLNALDNVDARRHVNRLCLAVNKPLIESGTTGYLGQVTVISKGETECYECKPKQTPKVHPICTIRSTPSKPVHCIVWAKQLFVLMFGKVEESMLYEDPVTGQSAFMDQVLARPEGGVSTVASEEALAQYSSNVLKALYSTEISKQLGMDRYKGAERTPVPLDEGVLEKETKRPGDCPSRVRERGWDRREWDEAASVRELARCIQQVYQKEDLRAKVMQAAAGEGAGLEFDKDNSIAMAFVAAASNLRSRVFQIPVQSLYEAKGTAGNIIPAIATTNAIIAGLQVMEALKILKGGIPISEACRYTYCLREPTRKGLFLLPTPLEKPARSCFVCNTNTLELCLDTDTLTLQDLVDKVLKQRLGINEPTVGLGSTTIYEEGEGADERLEVNLVKLLKDLPGGGVNNDTTVEVEDYSQDLTIKLSVFQQTFDEEEVPEGFTISGDATARPAATGATAVPAADATAGPAENGGANGSASTADDGDGVEIMDDDVVLMDQEHQTAVAVAAVGYDVPQANGGHQGAE